MPRSNTEELNALNVPDKRCGATQNRKDAAPATHCERVTPASHKHAVPARAPARRAHFARSARLTLSAANVHTAPDSRYKLT